METNRVSSGEWANTPDRLKAVITIGRPDFGRCPAATRLNRALWPLAGRPVLERLLDHVAGQGLRRAVVCGSEDLESIRRQVRIPRGLNVEYRQERLPRGSAGCVYDAADPAREETIIVLPGTMIFVNAGNQLSQIESIRDILSWQVLGSFALLGSLPLVTRIAVRAVRKRRGRKQNDAPTTPASSNRSRHRPSEERRDG